LELFPARPTGTATAVVGGPSYVDTKSEQAYAF